MYDFAKNLPGPGPGRPKGLKTKKVISTNDLIDLLNEHDYDPVVDQIRLSRDPDCPHGTRQKINAEFMKLLYPAVKAVEHSGSIEHRSFRMSWDMSKDGKPIPVETIDATPITESKELDSRTVETVEPTIAQRSCASTLAEGTSAEGTIEIEDKESDF